MKKKISISIEHDKILKIEKYVREGEFRNKSHALEKGLDIILNKLEENKHEQF